MKTSSKYFALFASIFIPNIVQAESRAVEETNAQASFVLGPMTSKNGNGIGDQWNASGLFTAPIARYLGVTVSGAYGENRVRSGEYGDCNLDSSLGGVGMFARDFDVGKISVNYDRERDAKCVLGSGLFTGNYRYSGHDWVTVQSVAADYYFSSISIGAKSVELGVTTPVKTITNSANLKYYPMSNLMLGLILSRQTYQGDPSNAHFDTSSITAEYQPELFGNSASVFLQASNARYPGSQDSNALTLGVTYSFGKQVDLMTRDRRYR